MRTRTIAGVLLALLMWPGAPGLAAVPGADGDPLANRARLASELTAAFFVGTWETRNQEFGRDVQIFWTLFADGTLAYRFVVDGASSDGSTGRWRLDGNIMHEYWLREGGREEHGQGTVERIDDDTVRLTILDNGAAEYTAMTRIYRRVRPAQITRAGD